MPYYTIKYYNKRTRTYQEDNGVDVPDDCEDSSDVIEWYENLLNDKDIEVYYVECEG